MIDIKKYICLYILNVFGILTKKSEFLTDNFLNNKKIKFTNKQVDIYGCKFFNEKNDFLIKVFAAITDENEAHVLVIFDNNYLGFAYNNNHQLISTFSDKYKEINGVQIANVLSAVENLKNLYLKPDKEEISNEEYKKLVQYINYSFDIIEQK